MNVNYLRFVRTEPLEHLLFQAPIHHTIGLDSSAGRSLPAAADGKHFITAGAAALVPAQGLKRYLHRQDAVFTVYRCRFQF